jgi:hypothetical protein
MEDAQEGSAGMQFKAMRAAAAAELAAPAVADDIEAEGGAVEAESLPSPAAEAAVKAAVAAAEPSADTGASGTVVGPTAPPAAADMGEGGRTADTVSIPAPIMSRCLLLLEDKLYAEGLARVPQALDYAVGSVGKVYMAKSQCRFRLLQELSSSGSAAGAGAALREDPLSCARWEEAETAAGSAASAASARTAATSAVLERGAETPSVAAAQTAAGAAAGTVAAAKPLVLSAAVPAVLGDILAAAAQGIEMEVKGVMEDGSKADECLRVQIVEARRALVARLEYWGRILQKSGPTAAAVVEDMALDLLNHVSSSARIGLGRPVVFSCYNPRCGNLHGLSEVGLVAPGVKGASRSEGAGVCGRCKAVCYCSRECQRRHWEKHRGFCRPFLKQQQQQETEDEENQK